LFDAVLMLYLSEPTADDDLAVCEELYRISALPVQISEERVLHTSEWERSYWRRDPDVDTDISGPHKVLEFAGPFSTTGEDGGRVRPAQGT